MKMVEHPLPEQSPSEGNLLIEREKEKAMKLIRILPMMLLVLVALSLQRTSSSGWTQEQHTYRPNPYPYHQASHPYEDIWKIGEGKIKTNYVRLGPNVAGVMYEPITPNEKSQIGILAMRSSGDYMTNPLCPEMAKRGYRLLCANSSSGPDGLDVNMDRVLLDEKLGVAYLRSYPGIRKVVLYGHSEGGALITSYQAIAENGVKACQGPEKIVRCPDSLAGLLPADGMLLISSSWGLPGKMVLELDPAVVNEEEGQTLNPELDLFNPKNGYSPTGSTYSSEFVHKFQSAVAKRNNQLIKTALERSALIKAGKGRFSDDEPFLVPSAQLKGDNLKLFTEDVRLMSHTHNAWPLLLRDGSTVTQVVHSARVPQNPADLTPSYENGTLKTTVRHFLSTFAIRVTDDYGFDEDSIHGVEWTSSYSSPPGMIEGITSPLLVMGMAGDTEYLASEIIFEHANKSNDKSLVFVEGALHHEFGTCIPCEKYPGQFGDTKKTTYDYIDNWLSKKGRFANLGKQ
jgi:hypothetical protein